MASFDEIVSKMTAAIKGVREAVLGKDVREFIASGYESVLDAYSRRPPERQGTHLWPAGRWSWSAACPCCAPSLAACMRVFEGFYRVSFNKTQHSPTFAAGVMV